MRLRIKVIPKSSEDCVVGWIGETLKIRVKASPEGGKANIAVENLIADFLGLSRNSVSIVAGKTKARKTIEIHEMPPEELHSRLPRDE